MESTNTDEEYPTLNVLTTIDPVSVQNLKWEIKGFGWFFHSDSTCLSQIFGPLDGFKFMLTLSKQTSNILDFKIVSLTNVKRDFGTLDFQISLSDSKSLDRFAFNLDFNANSVFSFNFEKLTVQNDFTMHIHMLYVRKLPSMPEASSKQEISTTSLDSYSPQQVCDVSMSRSSSPEMSPKTSSSTTSFEIVPTHETKSPIDDKYIETVKLPATTKQTSSFNQILEQAHLINFEKSQKDNTDDSDSESNHEEDELSRSSSPTDENTLDFADECAQLTAEQINAFRNQEFMDGSDDYEASEEQIEVEEIDLSDDYESSDEPDQNLSEEDPVDFDALNPDTVREENEDIKQKSYLKREMPKFVGAVANPKLDRLQTEFEDLQKEVHSHVKWIISEFINGDSHVIEDLKLNNNPIHSYITRLETLIGNFKEIDDEDVDNYAAYVGRLNEWFDAYYKDLETLEKYIYSEIQIHQNLVNEFDKLCKKVEKLTEDFVKLTQRSDSYEYESVQMLLIEFKEMEIEFEDKEKEVLELMVPTIVYMDSSRLAFEKLRNLIDTTPLNTDNSIEQKLLEISASVESFVDENMTDLSSMNEDRLLECREHLDDFLNQINSVFTTSNDRFDEKHEKCRCQVKKWMDELNDRLEPWNEFQITSSKISDECQEIRTLISSIKSDKEQTRQEKIDLLESVQQSTLKSIKMQIKELRQLCNFEHFKSNLMPEKAVEEVNRLKHKHRVLSERCVKIIEDLNSNE